ncbi:MAG: DUF1080 domain-containing protein [Verrucomicrobiae bacterium]|nr:DUF1080 domain-containing protein [Verrucomicrobiae bacterium]
MKMRVLLIGGWLMLGAGLWAAPEAVITVDAAARAHRISPYLTGACLEDVNHEVYGGLDSQMVFGESFAEPAPPLPVRGFTAYGGSWTVQEGVLHAPGGDGPKLLCDLAPALSEGEVSVEVFFPERAPGNAGLIVKVSEPGVGADRFTGYEIALETSGRLVLGRHRQNWEPIRTVPCEVAVGQWNKLAVRMEGTALEVRVNERLITRYEDTQHPLGAGLVGLRTWQREARFRNLVLTTGGAVRRVEFAQAEAELWGRGVSGMWRPLRRGSARGEFGLETRDAYSGPQSQRLTFSSGVGEIGIENQGLNRWGMYFQRGRVYEGLVVARAAEDTELWVALESRDGARVYAERRLPVAAGGWQKLNFKLTPGATDPAGRLALKLKQPGSVVVGYALLQPGAWGRFKGLPVRRDVAEALVAQGLTVMRYGGCMVNAPEYRWKKMIGPREQRPPYKGWWYPYASNGWGIFDFLNFCEAAGFLAIPAVNMGETPQDMADFIEYVNGPPETPWGRRRVADGHRAPYRLRHLQLGNEERVDEAYYAKFKALAEAIWARDPEIILVVGDFAYEEVITDPQAVRGAASRITHLNAQRQILELARQHGREVWFDVHVWTDGPRPTGSLEGALSFRDALEKLVPDARFRLAVFELNANNPAQRRALANALALQRFQRDGRVPVVCSANCLQPDGQNDNGWDQGLLFLNPAQVWLQPPGYVTRLFARHYQPWAVRAEVQGAGEALEVTATRSEDGRALVVQVVNLSDQPVPARLELAGFVPARAEAVVEELAGPLDARNTAAAPERVAPQSRRWRHGAAGGPPRWVFAPHSVTFLQFK